MDSKETAKILFLATEEKVRAYFDDNYNVEPDIIENQEEFYERFEDFVDGAYDCIVCGSKLDLAFVLEVAQVFVNECPNSPLVFASSSLDVINRKDMEKNGLTRIFILPIDTDLLDVEMNKILDSSTLKSNKYKAIRFLDIEPGEKLNFDTFIQLPINKKFVKLSKKDSNFDKERFDRLASKELTTMFVSMDSFEDFCKYTADKMQSLGSGGFENSTENKLKLESMVRNLFSHVFDSSQNSYEDGKKAIDDCKKVVSSYVTGGDSNDIYKQLLSVTGSVCGAYAHATAVSTMASLIAIGVDYPEPEDVSIAAFFHDLSLWKYSDVADFSDFDNLSEEMKKVYLDHPRESVDLIKEKKMSMSTDCIDIILQHHERRDGEGFPLGNKLKKIHLGAQILSFADQLEYLTAYKPGKKRYTVIEAFEIIKENNSISIELIMKIAKLLPMNKKPAKAKAEENNEQENVA